MSDSSTNNTGNHTGRLPPLSTPRNLTTPNRRAISAEPSSNLRLSASARRNPNTPHARAAIRAIDQRRAALFTPGRVGRRRSLARERERETPRDLLRNLSRVLAPTSTAVSSSSSSPGPNANSSTLQTLMEEDDDDDEFPIERPRFSLPLDNDDEYDSELKPPRSSILEDENYTVQSIELPRRVWNEAPPGRDRVSFGSVRMSDFIGPDIDDADDNNVGIDSGFFPPPALDDTDVVMDEDAIFERVDEETRRQTMGGRDDFGPIQIPDIGNESTFVMAPVESPTRDPTITEGIETGDAQLENDDDDDIEQPFDPFDMGDSDVEGDGGNEGNEGNEELNETIISQAMDPLAQRRPTRRKNGKKISRHGIEYPSLPQGVVKRLATTLAKTAGVSKAKISPDTLDAIMQATDWFFEQLGDDLAAYAGHAGRKTIDESDMMMLMRRQRQTNASTTTFALAQRHLPRELLQELRMSVPPPTKAPRKKQSRHTEVDEEEEVT
ncbi:uncharacterized protein F4807DRAFT_339728 [Annulohypoxylon truncatum]|uniref:uncharacterized protein n=1 Tax=Annulohypoxylon truncatum TaxID=327061 RepID=UPI0020073286|nr:uncharacterized protein F4807DRAFT_339728 [Annulohypoxylon truncatum]KAI1212524.1 hypothetical protein F4807DRAFT_339728 [Annulohypoxylon truncatum]